MRLKRFLAFVVAFAMVMSIVPAMSLTAFAEDSVVATINGVDDYSSLQAAIDKVQDGDTIVLQKESDENVSFTQTKDVSFVLDGNNQSYSGNINITARAGREADSTLVIQNFNFKTTETTFDFIKSVETNYYPNNITVKNCSFEGPGANSSVVAIRVKSSQDMNIENCTGTGLHSFLQNTAGWNMTIKNVKVTNSGAGLAMGTMQGAQIEQLTVDGGEFGVRFDAQGIANNTATVKDCTITADMPVVMRKVDANAYTLTMDGKNNLTANQGYWCVVSTGNPGSADEAVAPENHNVKLNLNDSTLSASGVFGVEVPVKYAAYIGEQGYITLAEAVNEANAGDVVVLYQDVESLPVIKEAITIDGNGHHITAKADENQFGVIEGTVTIKNFVFDNGTEAIRTDYGNYGDKTDDYANLHLVIEGCTFNNINGYAIMGGQTTAKKLGALTVTNCTFNAGETTNSNYMVYAQQVGELNVTGCTFNGNDVTKGAIHTGDSLTTATVATISGNTISGVARGIQICNRVAGSSVEVDNNTFTNVTTAADNKAGAIYVHNLADENVAVSVTNNTATGCTNVMYNDGNDISEIVTTYEGNTKDGKAIYIDENGNDTETAPVSVSGEFMGGHMNTKDPAETFITTEIRNLKASTEVIVAIYSGEALIATSKLLNKNYFVIDALSVKTCLTGSSGTWETKWEEGMPRADYPPTSGTLYVDTIPMNSAEIKMRDVNDNVIDWTTLPGVNPSAPTEVTTYAELVAALNAGKDVVLLNDIKATGAVDGTDANIDLGGNKLTLTVGDNNFFGTSTVSNGTIDITGCVAAGDCIIGIGDYSNSAELTLNNVNITGNGYSSAYAVLYVYNTSTLNINGGSIVVSNEQYAGGGVIKAHSAANGKINITGTESDPVELTFTDAKIGILDGTVVMNYVDLDITGGANAINQSALTVKNSTLTIKDCDGRALTLNDGDVTIENSTLDFSGATEGEIRFKKALTLNVDENTNIAACDIWTDVAGANVNGVAVTGTEDAMDNVTVVDGVVTIKTAPKVYEVATKTELDNALKAAVDGDTILLTADIDYGTTQLAITKAITLDLGEKTLTTRNAYGGMSIKNGPSIKNGTIVHASNTAAIKVWNAVAFEDLVIDVQGKGDANKTIGGIVLQESAATRVDTIKNVTIKGVALTNGIETYNCGNATENVIGSMENVTIDAQGTGMLISAPCGTATNCDIKGGVSGIELWIKGTYSASIDLVKSTVEGGTQTLYIHDEFKDGVVNNGTLTFTMDEETVLVSENGAVATVINAHESAFEIEEDVYENVVATIGNANYTTLASAIKSAKENDTIQLLAGEFSEGTIKMPAELKNVTIKGAEGKASVLKDMTIMAADGNSIAYDSLTFDGIVFDNSRISITGWRSGEVDVKNFTVTNCEFKNLDDNTSSAPVHMNLAEHEAIENFTFKNNVIDGATGGSKSGIYAQCTGDVLVEGNVINNVAFRPFIIQITTDDGIEDNFTVTNNTFSGSAQGRAQGLGNNAEGTDKGTVVVTENIFKDITSAQQICYWDFNEATTTATLEKNYYDIDIAANPNKIYYNKAAASVADLMDMGIYPIYTELNEDGTINKESLYTPPYGSNSPAYTKEVDGYVRVWGEGGGNAKESFVLKLYSNDTHIATTELNNIGGIINGAVYVTWNFFYPNSTDEYWTTTWEEGHPNSAAQPTHVELWIDDVMVCETEAQMNGSDDLNPVKWEELGGVEYVVTGLKGSGTEKDPYLISNLDELKWFRDDVNTYTSDGSNQYKGKYVKLMADIDLEGENWTPIGTNSVGDHSAFLGTFDGNNKTIHNLYINGDGDHLGFFARVGSYAEGITPTVKNITFNNVDVSSNSTSSHAGSYVGGVIANAGGNTYLENVNITGDLYVVGYGYVGGIVGHGYPKMSNCSVKVNGGSYIDAYYWCAGALVGYAGEGSKITDSEVDGNVNNNGKNLYVWGASGGAGAAVGLANDSGSQVCTLTNNTVKNVDVAGGDFYSGVVAGNGSTADMSGTTAENVTTSGFTATDAVAMIGNKVFFDLQAAIDAANAGDVIDVIAAGTYKLSSVSNKTFTINGAVEGVVIDHKAAVTMSGCDMTFKNVTIECNTQVNYIGFHHSAAERYENCVINGEMWTYGTEAEFTECTFNQTSSGAYNLWTYGSSKVTLDKCELNSAGKSVLLYNEGAVKATELTVIDTDFVASTPVEGKAAIEIDTSLMGGESKVVIDELTTATGFAAGSVSGNTLWNDKKDKTNIEVYVDGVQVWPVPALPTATVEKLENDELTFALNFKADEVTDAQLAYYGDWLADFVLTVNKDVTFNANGGADGYLSGQYDAWSENWVNVPFENVTLKAGESIKILEYAMKLMGYTNPVTYATVYEVVKDFNCGVFLEDLFLIENPDFEVTLELRMYNPENEEESYVIGEAYEFVAPEVEAPALPTATVTTIANDDLTFALNFKADEATDVQLAYYGDWFADFELKVDGTVDETITFYTGEGADGYLSGQYDEWSENWVNVPFNKEVTVNRGETIKIMALAAEIMGQAGLKLTYNDVVTFVKDFDCGVFFEPEFIFANPDLEVTLELRMYNPENEEESYVIGKTYEFVAPEYVATITDTEGNTEYYTTLQNAIDAVGEEEEVIITLLKNVEEDITIGKKQYLSIIEVVTGEFTYDGTVTLADKAAWLAIDEEVEYVVSTVADKPVVKGTGEGKVAYTTMPVGLTMAEGAQVRIGEGVDESGKVEGTKSGLRFVTTVNKSDTVSVIEGAVFGATITAEDNSTVTVNIPTTLWQDDEETVYTSALTNIAEKNYVRKFTATPYVTVKGVTFYGNSVTRSIYQVAAGLLTDDEEDAANLISVLNAYANQTGIRLVVKDGELKANTNYTTSGAYQLEDNELHFEVSDAAYDEASNSYSVILTAKGNAEIYTDNNFWYDYIRINNNNTLVKDKVTVEAVVGNAKAVKVTFNADGLIARPASK